MDLIVSAVSRRRLLRAGASLVSAAAMPSLLPSFARAAPAGVPPFGKRLTPPVLTPTPHYISCARPHRNNGVNLSKATLDTSSGKKTVIHNYGHSGAGITLSFGCASVAADLLAPILTQMQAGTPAVPPKVAVLGCGVIGLTVATELRKRWPQLPITIYASHKETDLTDITSFKAGGQFEPTGMAAEYHKPKSPGIETLFNYVKLSYAHIGAIPEAQQAAYGVERRWNYTLKEGSDGFDNGMPKGLVPPQIGHLPFPNLTEQGRAYYTWLVNPHILLPKLIADLKARNVAFVQRTFAKNEDWGQMPENVLMNCTGIGAAELFGGDRDVYPIRGQLAIFPNTGKTDYFFSGGCGHKVAYMFGRQDDIVVGGTWEPKVPIDARGRCEAGAGEHAECDEFVKTVGMIFKGQTASCHH